MVVKKMMVGPIGTNCYIVNKENSNEALVVDPGAEGARIERYLKEKGLVLKAILLTHGHFDHIGAAEELKKNSGAKIYAYKEEEQILTTRYNLGVDFGMPMSLKADVYLDEGEMPELAGIKFKLIATPGHTIGGCCFYDKESRILFSGDTMFCGTYGRTDFPTGSQSSLIRSIREKLLKLDDDVKVYPGHNEETTIGYERPMYDYN